MHVNAADFDLDIYSSEAHNTETRAVGVGLCVLAHHVGGVIAPFAVDALDSISFAVTAGVFGAIFLSSVPFAVCLRRETAWRNLVELDDLVEH